MEQTQFEASNIESKTPTEARGAYIRGKYLRGTYIRGTYGGHTYGDVHTGAIHTWTYIRDHADVQPLDTRGEMRIWNRRGGQVSPLPKSYMLLPSSVRRSVCLSVRLSLCLAFSFSLCRVPLSSYYFIFSRNMFFFCLVHLQKFVRRLNCLSSSLSFPLLPLCQTPH